MMIWRFALSVVMKMVNKALLGRLKKITNKELLQAGHFCKVQNMVDSSTNFQRDYDTVLQELKERGLLRK